MARNVSTASRIQQRKEEIKRDTFRRLKDGRGKDMNLLKELESMPGLEKRNDNKQLMFAFDDKPIFKSREHCQL